MPLHRGNAFRAGAWVLSGIVALLLLAFSINASFGLPFNLSLFPPGHDYTLNAAFLDANGVDRGADVVIGGNSVGQVTGTSIHGGEAVVSMRIGSRYAPLRRGTIARVRYSTLLAQKYIELTPGQARGALRDGATIGTDETVTPVDFDQFLRALDPQTRQRLQVVIQQAGAGLSGQQGTINDLLTQLHGLSQESQPPLSTFYAHDPDISRIVMDLGIVSSELGYTHQQLGQLVGSMDTVTGTLASRDTALATLIARLGDVMADFDATLSGNQRNLHETVVTLDPMVQQLDATAAILVAQLGPGLAQINANSMVLTPEAGSAVSQQGTDGQGNVLREYLVANANCDQLGATGCQKSGTAKSSKATSAAKGKTPGVSGLLKCVPAVSTPRPLPLPTPRLSPLPCPTIKPTPLPTPNLPCMPAAPKPKPVPTPHLTPSVCPSLPVLPSLPLPTGLPSLGAGLSWLNFLLEANS